MTHSFSRGLVGIVGTLAISQVALALPTMTITPTGPTTFTQGQANAQVTFNFVLDFGANPSADDVVVFHDVFVGYDPNFLQYNSHSFGANRIVLDATLPDDNYQDFGDANYLTDFTFGGAHGWTYIGPNLGTPVDNGSYWDGSLVFFQDTEAGDAGTAGAGATPEGDVFPGTGGYAGQSSGFIAWSITFDVITTNIGTAAIVMIDDRLFTNLSGDPATMTPAMDFKHGNEQASFYPVLTNSQITIQGVPVPAPLTLIGLGLAGIAAARQRRR